MERTIDRLIHDGEAQDLIEYALLSALLAVACITGILKLTRIIFFFAAVGDVLSKPL